METINAPLTWRELESNAINCRQAAHFAATRIRGFAGENQAAAADLLAKAEAIQIQADQLRVVDPEYLAMRDADLHR